jgi:tRNA dimethylallyltransferase
VLIAGPTASGKSGWRWRWRRRRAACIVNADALQVYDCWRVLTARPSAEEEAQAPHLFMAMSAPCSPGRSAIGCARWRRLLAQDPRPVIVGEPAFISPR